MNHGSFESLSKRMGSASSRRALLRVFAGGMAAAAAGALLPRRVLSQTPRETPTATPDRTATETATPRATETPRPTLTPTARPAETATPTSTVRPAETATPTSTVRPAETATPTSTARPAPPEGEVRSLMVGEAEPVTAPVCCETAQCDSGLVCIGGICGDHLGRCCAAGADSCGSEPCCPATYSCCTGDPVFPGGPPTAGCWPAGSSCCNGACCEAGQVCCGGQCCPSGQACVGGVCCPSGQVFGPDDAYGITSYYCCPSESVGVALAPFNNQPQTYCCADSAYPCPYGEGGCTNLENGACPPSGQTLPPPSNCGCPGDQPVCLATSLNPSGRTCLTQREFDACIGCVSEWLTCKAGCQAAGLGPGCSSVCTPVYNDCLSAAGNDIDPMVASSYCLVLPGINGNEP
jgi:hypothetical protein